jgi:DNA modification methylase
VEIDTIVCGDCLDVMRDMPDGCVDLVFADYPFSFSSNEWDVSSNDAYQLIEQTIPQIKRIVTKDGALYLMLGHDTVAEACIKAKGTGLNIVNWLIWSFGVGYHPTTRYKTRAYHILFCAKSDDWLFNGDDIRIAHKTIDKRNNNNGAIPSDIWTDIPDVKKNSFEYCGHKGQKPERLIERIIKASSNPGDLIFDPFIGSGTTAVAALKLGRHFYGCDINPEYVKLANERIEKTRLEMSQIEMVL